MRVEGFIQGQALSAAALSDILSRLNPGDVVRAQILEIFSNEVLLKLFDGTQLKASTMADIDAGKGEYANFIVKNKTDNQLFLEQIKINKSESLQSNLAKLLESAGIKASQQNLEIAEKFNQNFIPLKKDLFDKAIDMMIKFKDLGASKAVFLAYNNVSPEGRNIEALKSLVDSKMQVSNEIEQIITSLTAADKNISVKSSTLDSESISRFIANGDILQLINEEAVFDNKSFLTSLVKGLNLEPKIKEFLFNSDNLATNSAEDLVSQFIKDLPVMLRPKERLAISEFLYKLANKFSDIGSNSLNSVKSNMNIKDELENLRNEFKDLFIKLDTDKIEDKASVKEIYKELYEKLENIKNHPGLSSLTVKDELMQRTENLQNNIRFINDINQHNSYIQIPINMFNRNSTGELFILKRESKKKKINPDDVTMLVALDTQFIGRLETLITITKKSIALNLRVSNEKVISFLKENYKELHNRMIDKGYKLVDVKYRLIDEPVNVVNANEIVTRELNQNKVSVDIKL